MHANSFRLPKLPAVLLCAVAAFCGCAADGGPVPEKLALWPGEAPIGDGRAEKAGPVITVYRAAAPNGAAVVICPGGGYGGLVTGAEGSGIAAWLNGHGIAGVVLEYRLPAGRPFVPLLDAQRAIRTVRARAAEWGLAADRIGIIGFSAGGHLASSAATHFDDGNPSALDPVDRVSCRPDFAILIYPVISMGPEGHGGSRANLFGPNPSAELLERFSNEKQVTARTCPTFLAHALDDRAVPIANSRLFYDALVRHGVPGRLLELPSGDHGLNGYRGPMWDAWQTESIRWLAALKLLGDASEAKARAAFPAFELLAAGPQRAQLLPGQRNAVFSMYGAPGDLATLKQLVEVMRAQKLGNGFDPGPGPQPSAKPIFDYLAEIGWPVVCYPGADMQVKGGRGVLGKENEAALTSLDRAGVFSAVQLGEWGYYFHNLSCNEGWWRDNFGEDFDAYKHLMKPAGLAGYDVRPAGKQACYDAFKDYFTSRSRDLLGRVISVTGHSHYEAYAGEWGARCVGLEVGENIAFTQSKLAFARGASRAWQKPWSVQVSPWFGGACTTSGPLRLEGGDARGLDAGHSLSFYARMWLHAWFAGAALVTPENSIAIFFEKPEAPWTLTSHGKKAAEVFALMQAHERGIPYTPIAIVLDHLAGYNGYMDRPWGILEPTPGDREVRDLFDHQLFPGADHIHAAPDPENPEASYLRATPYGEIVDVLLTSADRQVLASYPVLLLAGDIEFDAAFRAALEHALRSGCRVLAAARHRDALGADFARLARLGALEVLAPWVNPATGRTAAIADERLASLCEEYVPIEVDAPFYDVQYQLNRLPGGWVIELVNNNGVAKKRDQPAVTNLRRWGREVLLAPRFAYTAMKEWRSGLDHEPVDAIAVDIDPGETVFVEFTCAPGAGR